MSSASAGEFPYRDPVGPDGAALLLEDSVRILAETLVPQAAETDVSGVPRATIDALAAAGLLGSPLPARADQRELAEVIAGCDASTWFCWVQHQSPLRLLERAVAGPSTPGVEDLRARLLPGLRSGQMLAAVAFAHLRRPGPPNPTATRIEGGWRLEGTLDWVTSWDIADVVLIMAQGTGADAGSIVCVYLPAGRGAAVEGLSAGPALRLLAMSGTHTRPLTLEGVVVPDSLVGAVLDRETWLAADAVTSSDANPAAFGLARAAIADLDVLAEQRSDDGIALLAGALTQECRRLRSAAYAAADEPSVAADDRCRLRAASLDLVARATLAVVIARAGAAMMTGHSAERRVREAMFLQVQAQTAATRRASLDLLARRTVG